MVYRGQKGWTWYLGAKRGGHGIKGPGGTDMVSKGQEGQTWYIKARRGGHGI